MLKKRYDLNERNVVKGDHGAVDFGAVRLYDDAPGALRWLCSINRVGLSKQDKAELYRRITKTVRFERFDECVNLLTWFAKQNLPVDVTEALFKKVESWYDRKISKLGDCAKACTKAVYDSFDPAVKMHVAGTPADQFVGISSGADGNDYIVDLATRLRNRDLLVKTYSKMKFWGKNK